MESKRLAWVLSRFSHVWLCVTPWTVACQAPLSMGFSRQECWSGLLFPSPGDCPDPGIEPGSPALQVDSYHWAPCEAPLGLDNYNSLLQIRTGAQRSLLHRQWVGELGLALEHHESRLNSCPRHSAALSCLEGTQGAEMTHVGSTEPRGPPQTPKKMPLQPLKSSHRKVALFCVWTILKSYFTLTTKPFCIGV